MLPLALGRVHGSSRLGRSTRLRPAEAPLPLLLGLALAVGAALATDTLTALAWLTLAALLTVLPLTWWLSGRMDGLGGDAYGASIEASEAVMLTLAVLL